MAQEKDHLSDLERHMRLLEEKIATLRQSLQHWQKWHLEYAALHEEVAALPADPPPRRELARMRRDYTSDVLTRQELHDIFGKVDLKDRDAVVSVLTRRIDYVEHNIEQLERLLEADENKLAAASVIANPDAGTDEETGLPITDIVEQLDEDGNVLDFRLQRGGDVEPKIVEALKKAGLKDFSDDKTPSPSGKTPVADAARTLPTNDSAPRKALKEVLVPDEPDVETPTTKKSVSFADDTKPGHGSQDDAQSTAKQLEEIMKAAQAQEAIDLSAAVLPDDETADEREMRRQMLQYGMSEIGPVVAELELEEGDSDGWDDSIYGETEDEESEDEDGRSKRSVITDDYIERMKALEKRLGVQSAFTATPYRPEGSVPDEGIGRISVQVEPENTPATGDKGGKSVKFAPELETSKPVETTEPQVNPLSDVLERGSTSTTQTTPGAPAPTKRPSRFRKERGIATPAPSGGPGLPLGPHQVPARFRPPERAAPRPADPTGPDGRTIAATVVEREVSEAPRDPDEFDNELLLQAANVEYNRLHNRMVQRQGGYMQEEDEAAVTYIEDVDEEPAPRVSRFKAARMSQR